MARAYPEDGAASPILPLDSNIRQAERLERCPDLLVPLQVARSSALGAPTLVVG